MNATEMPNSKTMIYSVQSDDDVAFGSDDERVGFDELGLTLSEYPVELADDAAHLSEGLAGEAEFPGQAEPHMG